MTSDLVADHVEDPEERERRNAGRDGPGNGLPVGDDDAGETVQFADGRRNCTVHVAGAVGLFEDRVFGFAAESYVSNSACRRVAADAVPFVAAVGTRPGVEDAQVRFA